jgi:hypothetical protein
MISIDTIYQRVLALANKEQRGYITPQEFNLFANQAQMDIFEQYFYDINQISRTPGNQTEFSNHIDILNEKINLFEVTSTPENLGANAKINLYSSIYRLGTVIYRPSDDPVEIEEVERNELLYINKSSLLKPTSRRPVYIRFKSSSGSQIQVYPTDLAGGEVSYTYITQPNKVSWGYVVVNDKAMYDPSNTVNFSLHASEEGELTNRILGLAGITLKQPDLSQAAAQSETVRIQQEKQ